MQTLNEYPRPQLVRDSYICLNGMWDYAIRKSPEGLFRNQSAEYQEKVLPKNAKIFGLTAGLPVNLLGLVGNNGKIWGVESFGFSAPYKVLDEKLGFTAENVYKQVKEML